MPRKPSLFNRCMEIVFANEGGYVDHPSDPGGKTKYGITERVLHDYDPNLKVEDLDLATAKKVYKWVYWDYMNLEGIQDENLLLQIYDFGVNAGFPPDSCKRSIRMIQGIVNAKPIDGICGPVTRKAINEFKPIIKMESGKEIEYSALDLFKAARIAYYRDLANRKPEMNVFLRGWLNRVEKTKFS